MAYLNLSCVTDRKQLKHVRKNSHSSYFSVKTCSIKLKDEEAEIEVTGSPLEEEANITEIEDAQIWLPNIEGFIIPLVGYWTGSEGQRNTASCNSFIFFKSPYNRHSSETTSNTKLVSKLLKVRNHLLCLEYNKPNKPIAGAKTNDIIAKPGAAHFESMCCAILALFCGLFRCFRRFELILLGLIFNFNYMRQERDCSPNAD